MPDAIEPPVAAAPSRAPVRVLVVDDRTDTSRALEMLLRRIPGTEVIGVDTAGEARDILAMQDIAIALFDAQMPELRAVELSAGSATVIDFVVKPIDAEIFQHRIAMLLELHHSRIALAQQAQRLDKLAHDLRGPLHTISVGTSLLASDEQADVVRRIQTAIDRMTAMIDALSGADVSATS